MLLLAGRADLWDGQWESEIRERKTVEGSDNYWIHPVWTRGVKDMDRRSVDDALRLVGILPPRETKPKVRISTRLAFSRNCPVSVSSTAKGFRAPRFTSF